MGRRMGVAVGGLLVLVAGIGIGWMLSRRPSADTALLVVALLAVVALSGSRWWSEAKPSTQTTALFGAFVLLLVLAYAVGVLEWDVAGSTLRVRRQVRRAQQDVLATKDEVTEIAQLALKAAFVVADGSSRYGGTPEEHLRALRGYVQSLDALTKKPAGDLQRDIEQTIAHLNAEIAEKWRQDFEKRWAAAPDCGEPVTPPCRRRTPEGKRAVHERDGNYVEP